VKVPPSPAFEPPESWTTPALTRALVEQRAERGGRGPGGLGEGAVVREGAVAAGPVVRGARSAVGERAAVDEVRRVGLTAVTADKPATTWSWCRGHGDRIACRLGSYELDEPTGGNRTPSTSRLEGILRNTWLTPAAAFSPSPLQRLFSPPLAVPPAEHLVVSTSRRLIASRPEESRE
jgi:hypothetical protein